MPSPGFRPPASIVPAPGRGAAGFTLFELLVVLAILSILVTISVPAIYQTARKTPMRQACLDLAEACQNARMLAILSGATTQLLVRASDGTIQVQMAADSPAGPAAGGPPEEPPPDSGMTDNGDSSAEPVTSAPAPATKEIAPFSSKLPESVAFAHLVVNLQDLMEAPEVRVRFYPNGTSDAFAATLLSEQNEERRLTLEITTGRETIEVIR